MDRARQYTTVKDFERRNPHEVEFHDVAYDHQMLLNEVGRPADVREVALGMSPKGGPRAAARPWAAAEDDAEASKLVTETWEEYAVRVPVREANLNRYFAEQEAADHAAELRKEARAKVSAAAVERLMAHQTAYNEKHYRPALHTLTTDFDAITHEKMLKERVILEEAMAASRANLMKSAEVPDRRAIEIEADASFQRVLAILEQQRLARVAEEQRRLEEQRAREAAKKAEEERKKAAEAAAELARRQAEAEAKQAEQKRRNDERKAKARAEREQRSRNARNSIGGASGGLGATVAGLDGLDMTMAGQTMANLEGLDMTVVAGSQAGRGSVGGGEEGGTPRVDPSNSAAPADDAPPAPVEAAGEVAPTAEEAQ